jgi:DNA-binding MltR family transcriptional regulator
MSESVPRLDDLSRAMPSAREFAIFLDELDKLHPRAAVLSLSAFIDNMLERAIAENFISLGTRHFDKIFRNPGAPLGTFSAKINIAYALGILDAEHRSQLDRIRTIRNAFAHSVSHFDFDHPTIKVECDKLDPQRLLPADKLWKPDTNSSREKFTVCGQLIGLRIANHIQSKMDECEPSRKKS